MFHKMYNMYININNKEATHAAFLITRISYHKYINKVSKIKVNSHDNHHNEFPLQVRMIAPPDLHHIQPGATQVWNFDEIGLDPNGKFHKVVCTYKYLQG